VSEASTLSGGQRQQIGSARTFIRDARILILNEPTASVDAESEELVMDGLRHLAQGRTVINDYAQPRHDPTRRLDHLLHDGIVSEPGTPDELVSLGRIHAELYWTRAGASALTRESNCRQRTASGIAWRAG
jgi:ABC-type multidrug transport system fused ATPase/permease subunit